MADAAPTIPTPVVAPNPDEPAVPVPEPQVPPEASAPPAEESAGVDASQSPEDELADIEKPVEPRVWKFEGDFTISRDGDDIQQHFEAEYTQKPLSYFGFLEFTGLLARKIDEAMRGPDGLTVEEMVSTAKASIPYVVDGSRVEAVVEQGDFKGIDAFVQGLVRVASYVPDVMEECQFIWLRVPRRERAFLRDIWGRAADEGGLTNEQGEEMLSVFIDQNYEELEAFFVERLPRIGQVMTVARERIKRKKSRIASPRSRPWSPTAETTPSQ